MKRIEDLEQYVSQTLTAGLTSSNGVGHNRHLLGVVDIKIVNGNLAKAEPARTCLVASLYFELTASYPDQFACPRKDTIKLIEAAMVFESILGGIRFGPFTGMI